MADKSTILHICPPTKGGIGKVITDISVGLKDNYRFLSVGSIPDNFPQAGINTLPLPFPNSIYSVAKFQYSFSKLIRKEKVDIIHAHGLKAALLLGFISKTIRVPPIIYTVHNSFDIKHISPLAFYLELISMKSFSCVVTVSQDLMEQYTKKIKYSRLPVVKYICNGIDLKNYINIPPKELKSPVKILNIGRLVSHKGQDILIKSTALLKNNFGVNVQVKIAGEGPWRDYLYTISKNLEVSDIVNFIGHCKNIPGLLEDCDIFVLSSRSEGTPLSLLEAMAAGKPVIASAVGGIPYIIGDGCGILVPPEDPLQLAKAINNLIKDTSIKRMGINAREKVITHFSLDKMLNSYNRLYSNILGGKEIVENN